MNVTYRTYLLLFAILLFQALSARAQGNIPASFNYPVKDISREHTGIYDVYVPFSPADLLADDQNNPVQDQPRRIAALLPAGVSLIHDGQKTILPEGEKIYRLHLSAYKAEAIILYYRNFYIPAGGKLFIYDKEHSQLLGAYTHSSNPDGGVFATEPVAGDEVILEYNYPQVSVTEEDPVIEIEEIGYVYDRNIITRSSLSPSGNCMVDINCEEGDEWQEEKRGVCKQLMRIGAYTYLCTGSLINNTAEDKKPYILTSQHCLYSQVGKEATEEEMKQWIFYFNYEHIRCGDERIAPYHTITGCKLLASSSLRGGSDGMLLMLNRDIPENLDIYFNGWDRRDIPAVSGVCIHHPNGDVKKISTFIHPAEHYSWKSDAGTAIKNGHWNISFSSTINGFGVTEQGSSGAPLFNQDKRIVGTLTGGDATCEEAGINLFGKLYCHWDKAGSNNNERMDIYLDPLQSGKEILDGKRNIFPAFPPVNLKQEKKGENIFLTWEAPNSTSLPPKYIIYRNYVRAGESTGLSYTDKGLPPGRYFYEIRAEYSGNHISEPTNQVATEIIPYEPPSNLQIKRSHENSVFISWTPPDCSQTISWGNIVPSKSIKMSAPFTFGHVWGEEELSPVTGQYIRDVTFFPVEGAQYSLVIKQGKNRYLKRINNLQYNALQTITPDSIFVIHDEEPLFIGIRVNSFTGNNPAMLSKSEYVDGKGNIIFTDKGKWTTLYNENQDIQENFLLATTLSYTGSAEARTTETPQNTYSSLPHNIPLPSGYKVFIDGESCTDTLISGNNIEISGLEPGKHSFYVMAVFPQDTLRNSSAVNFTLSNKSFDASIREITLNGEILNPSSVSPYEYEGTTHCGLLAADINIEAHENATVSIEGEYSRDYNCTLVPGEKRKLKIEIISESGENIQNYILTIKTPDNSQCNDATLHALRINGQEVYISPDSTNYHIVVDCELKQTVIEANGYQDAFIKIKGENTNRYTLNMLTGGSFPIDVEITSADGENTCNYHLQVTQMPQSSIIQRWDDVLTVVNKPEKNGGVKFVRYEWFCNGELIPEENKSYLTIPIEKANRYDDLYYVKLTTDNGLTVSSCEKSLQSIENRVSVYPNPIKAGEVLQIYIGMEEESKKHAFITVINSQGITEQSLYAVGKITPLVVSSIPGNYIIHIETEQGKRFDFKVIVY